MAEKPVPTLYEWAGGTAAFEKLFVRLYERVPDEPLLRDVFGHMSPEHSKHVAAFVAEVFGGPKTYSTELGGHPHMIQKHLTRNLTEAQRRRWIELLLDCADEVGLPSDPEFRSAFVAYLEWGSRLAVINSQPGAQAEEHAPMPAWDWGVPKGPYRP
ncbi:MAG TPA: group II truncated hemoglobin [Kofleriaceae bacterium]